MKCFAVKYLPANDNDVYGICLDLQSVEGLQSFRSIQEADDKGYWTGKMLMSIVFNEPIEDLVSKKVWPVFPEATSADYNFGDPFNYQDFTGTKSKE